MAIADSLYQVVTLSEASELYFVSVKTLRYHILRGNLDYRMAGKVYLISIHSLNRLYPHCWRDSLPLSFVEKIG
jgi:hypothetical protein